MTLPPGTTTFFEKLLTGCQHRFEQYEAFEREDETLRIFVNILFIIYQCDVYYDEFTLRRLVSRTVLHKYSQQQNDQRAPEEIFPVVKCINYASFLRVKKPGGGGEKHEQRR